MSSENFVKFILKIVELEAALNKSDELERETKEIKKHFSEKDKKDYHEWLKIKIQKKVEANA